MRRWYNKILFHAVWVFFEAAGGETWAGMKVDAGGQGVRSRLTGCALSEHDRRKLQPGFSTTHVKEETMPKSHMIEADRQGVSQNAIYLSESLAAGEAGDEEASWQWLALAELMPASRMSCKANPGQHARRGQAVRRAPDKDPRRRFNMNPIGTT
jgi:hypothetical protein